MWLVGVTEQLDGLRDCLRARLGPAIGDGNDGALTVVNHGQEGAPGAPSSTTQEGCVDGKGRRHPCRSSARVHVEPSVLARIRERNRVDERLHVRAGELFKEQCGRVGRGLA